MVNILFICHGNICRSPMAEFIFKDILKQRGISQGYRVDSAATSAEELGNPVYPPARRELQKHGISCSGKTARQVEKSDYDRYDLLIYMERYNYPRLMRILGSDLLGKCRRLMDFSSAPGDIDDPWYTGDFSGVYNQIRMGCEALADDLEEQKQ